MTYTYDYDFFVIGGGSGGVRAARIAGSHGAKVGLAEGADLGGTCVNIGCVPKKLFVYASKFSHVQSDAKGYGWDFASPTFRWKTLIENKDTEINRIKGFYESTLTNNGVTLHRGYAKFIDDHTIEVNEERITADKILISVGGTPRRPSFEGHELALVSDDMFALDQLPSSMVILGAGYIGVEFACIMKGLGVDVTLIYRGDKILRGFDDDIRDHLTEEMEKKDIKVLLNTDIQKLEKSDDKILVHLNNDQTITTGAVLSAIGRVSNFDGLNLEAANVEVQPNGKIKINNDFSTSVPHIYAVGDIIEGLELTPVALAEGHILADQLFNPTPKHKANRDKVAKAVFSQPPIATVGLTEEEAREQGHDVDIFRSSFRTLYDTMTGSNERSLMKIIVDKETDAVLGLHMCGTDAPEIMQGFAAALQMDITKSQLDQVIGIHPTAAEEFVTMREPVSD